MQVQLLQVYSLVDWEPSITLPFLYIARGDLLLPRAIQILNSPFYNHMRCHYTTIRYATLSIILTSYLKRYIKRFKIFQNSILIPIILLVSVI